MAKSKFELEYCELLVKHMALGHSYITIGAKLGIAPTTLYKWEKQYPEWAEAKEIGMLCCQHTWEDILINSSKGTIKTAPAALIFALKNYFPDQFKDNQQLAIDTGVTIVFESGVPRKNDISLEVEDVKEITETKLIEKNEEPQTNVVDIDIPYKSSILVDDSELL